MCWSSESEDVKSISFLMGVGVRLGCELGPGVGRPDSRLSEGPRAPGDMTLALYL